MATKMFDLEAFEKDTLEMREAIRKIANRKRPEGVAAVTHDERLRFAPPRQEFEELVPTVRDLAEKTGFHMAGISVEEMEQSLAIANTMRPLLKDVQSVLRGLENALEDTIDKERSNAYRIFLAYYAAMEPMANMSGDLQVQYDELVDLFKHGKRAKPKPEPEPLKATNSDKEAPDVKTPVVDKVG